VKEESINLLNGLLLSKTHLNTDLFQATHPEIKQRIIEILIENAVDDLGIYGKIRAIEGYHEDSILTEKELEQLKRKLFSACQIT